MNRSRKIYVEDAHVAIDDVEKLRRSIASALEVVRKDYLKLKTLTNLDQSDNFERMSGWRDDRYDSERFRARGRRAPRPRWQSVFQLVHYNEKDSFDYEAIMQAVYAHGFKIEKASLRPKLFFYIKKGYIDRVSEGRFKITRDGLSYFGIYE